MEISTAFLVAWLLQAVGFALVGDGRTCGLGKSFLMALICGPFAGLALVLTANPKPPMP